MRNLSLAMVLLTGCGGKSDDESGFSDGDAHICCDGVACRGECVEGGEEPICGNLDQTNVSHDFLTDGCECGSDDFIETTTDGVSYCRYHPPDYQRYDCGDDILCANVIGVAGWERDGDADCEATTKPCACKENIYDYDRCVVPGEGESEAESESEGEDCTADGDPCDYCYASPEECDPSWDGDGSCDCGCDFVDSDCPAK